MRELNIKVKIDEKRNKILVIKETMLNIPEGIDKEIYLAGVYNYLLSKHSNKINNKTILKIKENII